VVDGWVLPEDPVAIFQHGRWNDVPLIVGSTADDGPGAGPPKTATAAIAAAKSTYGPLADEYLKVFPSQTDAQAKKAEHDVRRDRSLYGAISWANLAAGTGHNKVFWYLFSHPAPVPPDSHFDGKTPAEVGAYHGQDNNYVFDNLRAKDWPWTDVDQKLAKIVSGMWVQFVKTGDPNGPGLPAWEPYNPKNPRLLNITASPKMAPEPYKTEVDFFEKAGAAGATGRRGPS
jgi:para-nitrobenzyl esterase